MLNLAPFLSQRLDPLAASQSITQAIQQQHARNVLAEQQRAAMVNEQENMRGSMAREAIANRGLGLQEQGMQWTQSKDRTEALANYVEMLRSGRHADAEAYAQTLGGMGLSFQQRGPQPVQAPPSIQQLPNQPTPPPVRPEDDRIDYSASNVDNIRGEPDQAREMAEARARVAELGGDTTGFELPSPPPPTQPIPQATMAPTSLAPLGPPQGPGVVDFSINGQKAGSINAQGMAVEQRRLAGEEGKALLSMVPQRFRGLAGGLADAPNMPTLKGRLEPWMKTQGDLFAGERAEMMGQARGMSMGMGERRTAAKEVEDLIATESAKTGKARERIETLQQSLEMAASSSSTAQRMAALQNAKQVLVGALSDRDMSFIFSSSGKWNELLMKLNAWTEGGALPEGFVNDMRASTRLLQTEAKRGLYNRAEVIANRIRATPYFLEALGPEWTNQYGKIAFSQMTGTEAPKPISGGSRGGGTPTVTARETITTKGRDPVTGRAPGRPREEPPPPPPAVDARVNRPDFLK